MREYLFRGKSDFNKWVYGSLIVADDYCCILEKEEDVHPMDYPYLDGFIGTFDGKATPVKPETVSQWTGLVDENGIKIFEGDIVKEESGKQVTSKWIYEVEWNWIYEVEWNTTHASFLLLARHKNGLSYFPIDEFKVTRLEIVGNIWDNPELVSEQSGDA